MVATARAVNVWGSPDRFYVGIELRDVGGLVIYSRTTGWVTLTNSYQDIALTVTRDGDGGVGESNWALVDSVTLVLGGDDAEYWAGNYGPKVDSASLKLDGTELISNTEFVDGDRYWTSSVGWQTCSGGAGNAPCPTTGLFGATAPGAPTSVSGTSGNGQVSVSWKAPASNGGAVVTDYIVQYSTSSSGTYTTFSDGASTTTTATVTGLTNNTVYYFKVAAVNYVGTGSYSTVSASVTPRSVPPVVSSVTAGNGSLTFTWNAITHGGNTYRIYWGTDSTFATAYSFTETPSTSYTATGLTNGTTYYFRVAGWIAGTEASTTNFSSNASGVPGAASAPTSLTVSSGRTGMSVSWTAPSSNGGSEITDYVVQYATTSGGAYTAFSDGTSTTASATITGLTAGSTYYVRVAAVTSLSTGTYSSESSGVLSKTCANGGVCAVGDTGPGGGKIFLTPSSSGNSTGYWFEAAPSNWYSGTDKNNNWCHNTSYAIGSGAQGTAIGAGYANTLAIVAYCTSGAAVDARAYSGGSLSDWFLPSDDELQAMYVARTTLSMPATLYQCCPSSGIVTTQSYWSSTENNTSSATWARTVAFNTGGDDNYGKIYGFNIRPIRRFNS